MIILPSIGYITLYKACTLQCTEFIDSILLYILPYDSTFLTESILVNQIKNFNLVLWLLEILNGQQRFYGAKLIMLKKRYYHPLNILVVDCTVVSLTLMLVNIQLQILLTLVLVNIT